MDEYFELDEWDELESLDESDEFGESDELDEARRRARGRGRVPSPIRTPPLKSAYSPRQTTAEGPVTQPQLRAALARVTQQIGTTHKLVKTVDARQLKFMADTNRANAAIRKDLADRKKEVEKLRADLRATQTISALLPFIAKPGSKFGQVAPLVHLLSNDLLSGPLGGSGPAAGGGLGNVNNLALIAGVAYASGAFD